MGFIFLSGTWYCRYTVDLKFAQERPNKSQTWVKFCVEFRNGTHCSVRDLVHVKSMKTFGDNSAGILWASHHDVYVVFSLVYVKHAARKEEHYYSLFFETIR